MRATNDDAALLRLGRHSPPRLCARPTRVNLARPDLASDRLRTSGTSGHRAWNWRDSQRIRVGARSGASRHLIDGTPRGERIEVRELAVAVCPGHPDLPSIVDAALLLEEGEMRRALEALERRRAVGGPGRVLPTCAASRVTRCSTSRALSPTRGAGRQRPPGHAGRAHRPSVVAALEHLGSQRPGWSSTRTPRTVSIPSATRCRSRSA